MKTIEIIVTLYKDEEGLWYWAINDGKDHGPFKTRKAARADCEEVLCEHLPVKLISEHNIH